ncbi:hypothetical protein MSG28_002465 [Choristoneura fumiferana]|uniref:Uncharacterized protein n=1 Tax=Choristoneura fumiferana TaxID=7141 RepID=A0ACC0JW19_CHOFU|nr:hypothetical protein MSG28_002465 [Choristoneura fumiferana]
MSPGAHLEDAARLAAGREKAPGDKQLHTKLVRRFISSSRSLQTIRSSIFALAPISLKLRVQARLMLTSSTRRLTGRFSDNRREIARPHGNSSHLESLVLSDEANI